jgi:hypothetical protein
MFFPRVNDFKTVTGATRSGFERDSPNSEKAIMAQELLSHLRRTAPASRANRRVSPRKGGGWMSNKPYAETIVRRIRSEFVEMPGLSLTLTQAQRLFGLDQVLCDAVLRTLVDTGFLLQTQRGTFMRYDAGSPVR